jgi:uncharacterized damage-inducible protein DinB
MSAHTSFFAAVRSNHARTNAELLAILTKTSIDRLRTRPHANMNTMVWSIWHSFRSEDACISRFVIPKQQVLTTTRANDAMQVPYLGDGFGMSEADVLALSATISIDGLIAYGNAVTAQSATFAQTIAEWDMTVPYTEAEVRVTMAAYADLASDDVAGTISYMGSMTKAEYLMKHLYGHSQYHLGEISAIDGQIPGTRFFTW